MRVTLNDYEAADIVKFIREDSGMTQEKFAQSIGKSRRMVQDYEYGTSRLYFDTFLKILKECGYEVIIQKKKK